MSPGGGGDCKERCNNCVLILTSKDEYTNINMTKRLRMITILPFGALLLSIKITDQSNYMYEFGAAFI